MRQLPITLCLFTSTKGHFGHKNVYKAALAHLDRQIPLSLFGGLVAHIKVSPSEEQIGADMEQYLKGLNFLVLKTVADWSRGQSHQAAYMADVVTLSKEASVYKQPFVLWFEDDQTITPHVTSAEQLLLQSCDMLDRDNELVSARLLRAGDLPSSPITDKGTDSYFYSPHVNFQPMLLRSRDFYLASMIVERSPEYAAQVQCEMFWRLILANFSRSEKKHIVYYPSFAETIHLGTPEYPELTKALDLL